MNAARYKQRFRPAQDLISVLDSVRSHTEVGRILGISRSLVFLTERDALRKVRERMLSKVCAPQVEQRISFIV